MHPTFIETDLFEESAAFLGDDELRAVQWEIAAKPDIGAVIDKTSGARKIRVALAGTGGKSGGARVIYVDNTERCGQIHLLLAYPKSVADNLTNDGKKLLGKIVRGIKAAPCI